MPKYFDEERAKCGVDLLMKGNREKIKVPEEELSISYMLDQSLYLRECAVQFMYY